MSRAKEAVVVLVGVGASMRLPLCEHGIKADRRAKQEADESLRHTRFGAAVEAVESVLQQKLFFKPKDEVGIVAYGSEDTDNQLNEEQGEGEYENVEVVSHIDAPTLRTCMELRKLKPSHTSDTKVDILDGLIVALDLLFRHTDGKKYTKRLMVITDASDKIANAADFEAVVGMIKNMDTQLQIIGLDFQHTTEGQANKKTADTIVKTEIPASGEKEHIKAENEKLLVSIAKEVGGEVCSVSKRLQLLAQGMKKTVALTTKFRGHLEFGDALGIPVYCYLKTKTATLPTLMKESQASYKKEAGGKVKLDRKYTPPQDPDREVPYDQQVKAYRYGAERVPFSSADVEFFKFQTEKSLKVLGFLDQAHLSHAMFVGGTDLFLAEPGKPHAAQCFAALVEAMRELQQVAIARFVSRKNAAPKIVALIPNSPCVSRGENYYALWSQQLPYEEDLRSYEFAPLKTRKVAPTEEQQELADKLVDNLSLRDDKVDELGVCFNPVIRRFFEAVSTRAMEDQTDVSKLSSGMPSSMKMSSARQEKLAGLFQRFGDAFQLKEAVKKQSERKKKSFWSDVPVANVKDETSKDDEEDEDAAEGSDEDPDELVDSVSVTTVGSENPIADFESLLALANSKTGRHQHLATAVTGLETQIQSLLLEDGANQHCKALQCLVHFRKRSGEIQYSFQFNDFLHKLKTMVSEDSSAWQAVKKADVTLLSYVEDPSLRVTPAEARAFLYGDEESIATASTLEDDDDDLYTNIA